MNQTQAKTAQRPARERRRRRAFADDPLDGVDVKGLGRGLDPEAVEAELEAILIGQARRLTAAAERALANAA
jgi:hypothetical protein